MKLVSIKDMKVGSYLTPNFQASLADALRHFEIMANEGNSLISRFPNDYRLVHLGDFDSVTGRLEVLQEAVDLGSAFDFLRRAPAQESPLPFPSAVAN